MHHLIAKAVACAGIFTLASLGLPLAHAANSNGSLSQDAQQAGSAVGSAARGIGHDGKKVGLAVGHEGKKVGLEIGHAAKDGGLAFWHAVKGEKQ